MRTRSLTSSLLAALALTASTLAPVLARAGEPVAPPAAPATDVAQGSSERGGEEPSVPLAAMPDVNPAAPVDRVERSWYGYQNLAADGAAFALFVAAGNAHNGGTAEALGWLGGTTYVLASPIIHGLHGGGVGRSLGSVALRAGLPVLGGVIGGASVSCGGSDDGDCGWEELGGIALGGLIGVGAAIVIDDFGLAVEERHVSGPMWAPTVAPSAAGGMTFGVAGTF
jgi:hypothetical protein